MDALGTNIGEMIVRKYASAQTDVTAGGTGDATEIVGDTIDISALPSRPRSVSFEIPVKAVLAATKTCKITADVEYSTDGGSTWESLVDSAVILTLTGATGGSTEKGVAHVGARLDKEDLDSVRINLTPDCSATSTDTANIGAGVAIFGGLDEVPQADEQDS